MIDCDLFLLLGALPTRSLVRCRVHTSEVEGRREGAMVLELESRWTLAFIGLLYVPNLRVILLSVSSLEDQGYPVEFKRKSMYLWPDWVECPQDVIMIGIKEGILYKVWGHPLQRLKGS